MVEQGVAYAIHHLEQLGLPAPRKLELARRFQLVTWIKPAVQSLLDIHKPLSSFSSETDVEYMGPKVYTIITRARELILRERALIANTPPAMSYNPSLRSFECIDHMTCRRVWKDVWWTKIARAILDPRNPLALEADGITFISTTDFPGMAGDCKADAIGQLRDGALCRNLVSISESVLAAICDVYGIPVGDIP